MALEDFDDRYAPAPVRDDDELPGCARAALTVALALAAIVLAFLSR